MMLVTGSSDLLDTFMGLPVHPLVVHFAVVLLPLSALGLIVVLLRPTWRTPYGYFALAGLVIGGGATLAAKESGEALAERVGLPQQHANLGSVLTYLAFALIVCAIAWFVVAGARGARWWLTVILAIGATALALTVTVLTVLVGHTGATAVWAGKSSDSPATSKMTGITMANVRQHATPSDCWTAIDGNVYDLTSLISQHEGGSAAIEGLCGTDGTSAFLVQHAGQEQPASDLAELLIGPLTS